MKSIIFYTSLIVISLVSSPSFGEILSTGDSGKDGTVNCEISCDASGNTTYDSDSYSEWFMWYTDTAGNFSWDWEMCNHVDGWIYYWDQGESAYAMAYSVTEVGGPESYECYAYNELEDENGNFATTSGTHTNSGTSYFEAYTGIWIEIGGLVVASQEEGSGILAGSRTYSYAFCGMGEH